MQIAPVGALEISLSSLASAMSAQQQVAQANVGQNSSRASVVDQKGEVDRAQATKVTADAADKVGLQAQQGAQAVGASGSSSASQVEASESLTRRELFDYLAEVEKSSGSYGTPPSALVQSGLSALDGTLQKIGEAMTKAKSESPMGVGDAAGGETQQLAQAGSTGETASGSRLDEFARQAEQMIDRSMSVMWAAANLEVVMGSVTAVTSSTGTLIKQQ